MADKSRLLRQIGHEDSDKEKIANEAVRRPEMLNELMAGLGARETEVRHGCAKVLAMIARHCPHLLHPRIQVFVDLLGCEDRSLLWSCLDVIAFLAPVDSKGIIDGILDRYLAPNGGPDLYTDAVALMGAARIATAKPHLVDRIAKEILKLELGRFQDAKRHSIDLRPAMNFLEDFYHEIEDQEAVLRFVRRQHKNKHLATREKAERFLKKRGLDF